MRLPSKQELLRVYPTWDVTKRKKMSPLITFTHGLAFLRLLRSGASRKLPLQKELPSVTCSGKRKPSPGADRIKKRFKMDKDQLLEEEVSSKILQKGQTEEVPEPQVQLTRRATKLQQNERMHSPSTSGLRSGSESRPIRSAPEQQHAPTKGVLDDGGIFEDESTVSSSLGPQNELFPEFPQICEDQSSLSKSDSFATTDLGSEKSVSFEERDLGWRPKRKSIRPRKVLRDMAQEIKTENEQGSCLQDHLLSQPGNFKMGECTDEVNVPESGQEMMVPVPESKSALLSSNTDFPISAVENPVEIVPKEQSGAWLLDQDPMLAEGNLDSCSSGITMVPSSSQEACETAAIPGLRFQSIQECCKNPDTALATPDQDRPSIMGDGMADVVNSSLLEESVEGGDLDILLPGMNLLNVGRSVTVDASEEKKKSRSKEKKDKSHKGKKHKHKSPHKTKRVSSAKQLYKQYQDGESGSGDCTLLDKERDPVPLADSPGKVSEKDKQKRHRKSQTESLSTGKQKSGHKKGHKKKRKLPSAKRTSNDPSSPLSKSPVFGRIFPVSNWTSDGSAVISPCHVQLVDHVYASQQTPLKEFPKRKRSTSPTNVSQQKTQLKKETVEIARRQIDDNNISPNTSQVSDAFTKSEEQATTKEMCPGVHISNLDTKKPPESESPQHHLRSSDEAGKVLKVARDHFQTPSHAVDVKSPPSVHEDECECKEESLSSQRAGSVEVNKDHSRVVSSPSFQCQQESVGQFCSSQGPSPLHPDKNMSDHSVGHPNTIDTTSASFKKDKQGNNKVKKIVRSKKSPRDTPRGAGGWEQSLRQRPAQVTLFQLRNPSKTPKSGVLKISPKKDSRIQQENQSEARFISRETPKDSISTNGRSSTPKNTGWRRKEPRAVAKPPPLDAKEFEERSDIGKKVRVEEEDVEKYGSISRGQLVFGKMKGFCWWPGRIVHHYDRNIRDPPPPLTRWVQWFGDNKYSLLSLGQIAGFEDFPDYFSDSTFQKLSLYQKACYEALNVAAKRAGREFVVAMRTPPSGPGTSVKERQEYKAKMLERCAVMRDWAEHQFMPEGRDSILPSEEDMQIPPVPESPPPSPARDRKRSPLKHSSRNATEKEPFQDKRDETMKAVRSGKLTIEEICIGCGSTSPVAKHPLFVGGLCEVCRMEYLEVAYLYDCEGYQAHCCICAEGSQITLCDNDGCYHSYCTICMDYLVGPLESKKVSQQEPWSCYLCAADHRHGYLTRRDDWQDQLVDFFNHDHVVDFEPLRVYKPILRAERRPIRVLSLFDGLGTGMLVLKDLGFDVECYYASEVSEEAITVAAVRLKGQIKQVGDVQKITMRELNSWGPFDLLIGGSPCNDLSIVNPARKGLEGGTGLLFFEFYRILRDLQPLPDDPRPFFWLFENVVFMGRKDKLNICRFLQCNPVMIDSRHMSPTHRARYYWGNLPGMHRPYVAGADNPLCLQECLEPNCNRQAQFSKVGTITTNPNSIRQTKDAILPVVMNGREDGLWSTELERLFGFPDHYTDVGNLSRLARQRLLGKAWSVPVIKHLMAPLKDYFACSAQKE